MLSTTKEFTAAMQSDSRKIHARVVIDGKTYQDEDIKTISGNLGVVSGDSFSVGTCYSNTAKIVFKEILPSIDLDQEVWIYLGVEVAEWEEPHEQIQYVSMGKFYIEDFYRNKNSNETTVDLADGFIYMGDVYTPERYIDDLRDIAVDICNQAGIEIDEENFSKLEKKLTGVQLEKYTCRDAIGIIAQLYSAFVHFNRDGKLEFRKLQATEYTIDKKNYFLKGLEVKEKAYKTDGIQVSVKAGDSTKDVTLSVGATSGNVMNLTNPLMTEPLLNLIWNEIKNIQYIPFELEWKGNPALEVGDWITILDHEGRRFHVPQLLMSFDFNGGLKMKSSAMTNSASNVTYRYKGSLNQIIEYLESQVAANGVNRISSGFEEPKNPKVGDIWFKTNGPYIDMMIYEEIEEGVFDWKKKVSSEPSEELINLIDEKQQEAEEALQEAEKNLQSSIESVKDDVELAELNWDSKMKEVMPFKIPKADSIQGIWEQGDLSTTTGVEMVSSTWVRMVDYVACSPGDIFKSVRQSGVVKSCYFQWYDSSKNYLTFSNGTSVIAPTGTAYFRASTNAKVENSEDILIFKGVIPEPDFTLKEEIDAVYLRNLVTGNSWVNNLFVNNGFVSNLEAKTITAITANINSIVTDHLDANVITSNMIKTDTAMIEKLFATTGNIEALTSKTAFINNIKAIDINADRITTGTFNAANVNIINLNASAISAGIASGKNLSINFNTGSVYFTSGKIQNLSEKLTIDLDKNLLYSTSNNGVTTMFSELGLLIYEGVPTTPYVSRYDEKARLILGVNGTTTRLIARNGFRITNNFNNGEIQSELGLEQNGSLYLYPEKDADIVLGRRGAPPQEITMAATKIYAYGSFHVFGSKNAIHLTRDGVRATPAYELAESYLGDVGRGVTNEFGNVWVPIEEIFGDTVNLDIPYEVFLQSYDNDNVWVSDFKSGAFLVCSNRPNIRFAWEIKAKRRGYESDRLELQEFDNKEIEEIWR